MEAIHSKRLRAEAQKKEKNEEKESWHVYND